MKTNEYRRPWEENSEDQNVNQKNLSKAKDQLKRDILRFSELLPDVDFYERIKFQTFVAFPLVEDESEPRNDCNILTKPDFESDEKLEKIFCLQNIKTKTTHDSLLKTIVARYVGLHSTIPLKNNAEAFNLEEKRLKRGHRKFDSAFKHSFMERTEEVSGDDGLRKKMSENKVSRDILSAINNKKYRVGKFKEKYNFPLFDDTDAIQEAPKEAIYPFRRAKSKNPVIIGKDNIKILLQYHDSKIGHQGLSAIIEKIKSNKIEIFDSNTVEKNIFFSKMLESDLEESLSYHLDCEQCLEVAILKERGDFDGFQVSLTKDEDIQKAIQYGDRLHRGE